MSKFLNLDLRDLLKGLVVAVLAAVLLALQKVLTETGLNLTMKDLLSILNVAALSAVGYLVKQLVTDDNGKIMGKL